MATKADQRRKVDSSLAIMHAVRDREGVHRPFSIAEIADVCDCSIQLIREIEQRALRKLRHPARAEILKEMI
ncbi:hypothetical protein EGM51_10740 [Verrucomicrobia bacterium S94]|nr:hypothetical protein EGM51_10740 [Verrucomicrobia bacterium S94]